MNNKQVSPRLNKVLLIYTGGTIGMGHNPDIKQKLFGSMQRYPLYGWNLHVEER